MSSNEIDAPQSASVEMFLSHGSHKPLILPPPKPVSSSTRRWRLLRNVARATRRRSSLTVPEEKLLQAMSKPSNSNSGGCAKRDQLRDSIVSKSGNLTKAEQSFLKNLVACNDVSPDHLEKVNEVLSKDPLYKEDSELFTVEKEETKPSSQRERLKLDEIQDGPSFREETWVRYMSSSFRSNQDFTKTEEKEKVEEVEEVKKPEKKISWFEKIFHKKDDEKKQEEDLETLVEDEAVEPPPPVILATDVNDSNSKPHVLSPPIMDALRPHMPYAVQEDNFWLKYSMIRDGASMRTLLQNVRSSARTIIAIETMDGDVFGSFTSSPWRPHGHEYYGSGEAFMWRLRKSRYTPCETVDDQIKLESDVEVFPWTGKNRNIQSLVNSESQLVLGGGGTDENPSEERDDTGLALMLEPTLTRGASDPSLTFDNPSLPTTENDMFEIANIEVWTVTPVENLDLAEKLEFGRQFVFDHGNFLNQ